MKIIINENQLKSVLKMLIEDYREDSYMKDNDIYHYEPTSKEIEDFNKKDRSSYHEFRGFDVERDPNKPDPNINFNKPIKFKKNPDSPKIKYTGMAKIVYTYPNGKQVDVPNTYGKNGVVNAKLKQFKLNNPKEADRYSIKYEAV